MRMSVVGSVYICGFPPQFQGSYLAFLLVLSLGFVSWFCLLVLSLGFVFFSFSFLLVFFLFLFVSSYFSLFIPNILRDAEGTLLSHPHNEGLPSISLK
jgi:hypothetical protein